MYTLSIRNPRYAVATMAYCQLNNISMFYKVEHKPLYTCRIIFEKQEDFDLSLKYYLDSLFAQWMRKKNYAK